MPLVVCITNCSSCKTFLSAFYKQNHWNNQGRSDVWHGLAYTDFQTTAARVFFFSGENHDTCYYLSNQFYYHKAECLSGL